MGIYVQIIIKFITKSCLISICNCSGAMRRMLLEGTTLIVDRYAFSGVAYSAAKPVRKLPTSIRCKVSGNLIDPRN